MNTEDIDGTQVVREWTNYFPGNIGQADAVRACNGIIHLEVNAPGPSYKKPIVFLGEASMGKTRLAKLMPIKLEEATGKEWKLVEMNPTDSPTNFFTKWQDNVHIGSPTVIFIDELHGVKKGQGAYRLEQFLKRALETERKVATIEMRLGNNIYALEIDPYNHVVLGATNEDVDDPALVGPAGRFRPVYIPPYNPAETAQLLFTLAQDRAAMGFTESALDYLSKRVKGSPREIDSLIASLQFECMAKIDLDAARRTAARDKRFPEGLDQRDVAALEFLAKRKNVSAGEISATLRETESATKNRLRILAGSLHCLSTGRGRFSLSDEGKKYLQTLANLQKEAAKLKVANARV